jgi:hypothetical protein
MENHFDTPLKTITKIANILCLLVGLFFIGAMFYLTFFTEVFNTGNKGDDYYGLFGAWFASLGWTIGSVVWFKYRLDNNV